MQPKWIAAVLTARLALAPFASAGEPPDESGPLRAAAAREAARLSPPTSRRGPMPSGLKWTGLGLLIGSGLPVFIAKFGDCIPDDFSCRDQRHAAYAVAGVMAGTGAGLLGIAQAKRSPAMPTIVLHDAAAAAAQPMRPGLKWTGIALVTAGAGSIGAASVRECHPNSGICKDQRRFHRGIGYVSGAAGATVLAIGVASRRDRATSIAVDGSRVTVTHRLTF